jgi:hypothetical protein
MLEPRIIAALKKLETAIDRLEKAAGRILGRQKAKTQYWTSEIRKPGLEDAYAIAAIAASPYSPYYEWKVIVVDRGSEFLAHQGVTENLEDAKRKVQEKAEKLYIWEGEAKEDLGLVWSRPLDTVVETVKEIMRGYRRWGVRFPDDPPEAYRALVVWNERKGEIEVVDPVMRKRYSVEKQEEPTEDEIEKEMTRRFGRKVVLEEIPPTKAAEAPEVL